MGPWAALRRAIRHPETRQRAWGTHLRGRERNEQETSPRGVGRGRCFIILCSPLAANSARAKKGDNSRRDQLKEVMHPKICKNASLLFVLHDPYLFVFVRNFVCPSFFKISICIFCERLACYPESLWHTPTPSQEGTAYVYTANGIQGLYASRASLAGGVYFDLEHRNSDYFPPSFSSLF